MKLMTFRYKVKPGHVAENEVAIKDVVAVIEQEKPAGVRYASFKLGDGVSFMAFVQLEEGATPLTEYPYFQEFIAKLDKIMDGETTQEILEPVGAYNFF